MFNHLLENNAVAGGNPVHGVKRPRIESNEGKTQALGDHQAKQLLDAPDAETLKGLRERAILAVLLYHGLRREEVAQLNRVTARESALSRSGCRSQVVTAPHFLWSQSATGGLITPRLETERCLHEHAAAGIWLAERHDMSRKNDVRDG